MENKKEFENIWTACLSMLESRVNDNTVFSNFFYDSSIESIERDVVTISATNSFAAQVLNKKYLGVIEEAINSITQSNYKCIVVDKNAIISTPHIEEKVAESRQFISNLITKFTFNNFVVGESNRESYTAAFATAMDPGRFYNPLFIYGKSGLGKTHLIHAIGNYVRDNNPNAKILYKSVDDFVEDVVKAFKDSAGIESLKGLYREVDLLLLDDVQFLSTKEKSKEVLFSIFNTLINSGKQIVLTSDRPVTELKHLEDRLVGRFSQGLSVQIKDLEFETAYKILKKKIEVLDINGGNIDEDVLVYLAENYASDVRKLEGALNKLLFYSITFNPGTSINMDVVKNTFDVITRKKEGNILTIDKIKTAVSEYYSISVSQLESNQRTANIAVARHIAMYLCRLLLNVSLNQIGDSFGGKDHSTVKSAVEKVDKLCKTNPDYLASIEELKTLLKNQ